MLSRQNKLIVSGCYESYFFYPFLPAATYLFLPVSTRGSRQNKTLTNKMRLDLPAGRKKRFQYYYRLHTSAASSLKKQKSHNPQATGQNNSENCGPTTRRIDSAAVGRIKGIPIHSLEGSCSGYPLIPYSAASDACSRRCVNPAAILSSPHCATSRAAGAR